CPQSSQSAIVCADRIRKVGTTARSGPSRRRRTRPDHHGLAPVEKNPDHQTPRTRKIPITKPKGAICHLRLSDCELLLFWMLELAASLGFWGLGFGASVVTRRSHFFRADDEVNYAAGFGNKKTVEVFPQIFYFVAARDAVNF